MGEGKINENVLFELGMAAGLPCMPVIWATIRLASGLPGTTPGSSLSPFLSSSSRMVMRKLPPDLAG